jgi:predicted dehydrogenase
VKILFAGLGSVGQRHARNLRTLLGDELELLAYRVRRTSPVIGTDLSARDGDVDAEYGVRSFDDLDAALAESPDAVFVTNPNSLHLPVALAAARAGCHLFVEKPLSHTLDGVEELVREIDERKLVCLVAYQLRFHPGFHSLQSLLAAGELGTLLSARIDFGEHLPSWHPYEDYREYHAARADQGGGVLLAQIHDLDLAYALFGLPRSVFAVGGKRSTLELDVEDTVDLLLDGDVPVSVHQDVVRRPPVRRYEVVGEDATAVWDYYAGTLAVTRAETSDTLLVPVERNELFLAEARHFLACVAGDEQPVVDIRAGLASLQIALAAKRSLESGAAASLG